MGIAFNSKTCWSPPDTLDLEVEFLIVLDKRKGKGNEVKKMYKEIKNNVAKASVVSCDYLKCIDRKDMHILLID